MITLERDPPASIWNTASLSPPSVCPVQLTPRSYMTIPPSKDSPAAIVWTAERAEEPEEAGTESPVVPVDALLEDAALVMVDGAALEDLDAEEPEDLDEDEALEPEAVDEDFEDFLVVVVALALCDALESVLFQKFWKVRSGWQGNYYKFL